MKPVVLAELAGSAGYGGGERYLEFLFEHIDRVRFRPILICPEPGPFIDKMVARHIPTHIVHLRPLFNPLAVVRLANLLKRNKVTVLQTHGARANVYGCLAARLAGVPCVLATIHNSIRDYEIGPIRRHLYLAILRVVLPLTDRLICVSDAIKRDVLADCPSVVARTITIRNGIDQRRLSRSGDPHKIRKEWSIGNGPVLLVVARLTEQKGHRFLIEALPRLLAEWPSLVCLFVGEGECRDTLRLLARTINVEHACRFVGAQNNVGDWYAAADVVVLPSLSEGLPFVVLEAMAMARPVVASSVNGIPEIIQNGLNGLLIPPRNPQVLEDAIRSLLRDPVQAARMGKAGQQHVANAFTVGTMIDDTVRVFEDAMPTLRKVSVGASPKVQEEAA
jgi:glycosyltransferase involved in cell wall biosynthesis